MSVHEPLIWGMLFAPLMRRIELRVFSHGGPPGESRFWRVGSRIWDARRPRFASSRRRCSRGRSLAGCTGPAVCRDDHKQTASPAPSSERIVCESVVAQPQGAMRRKQVRVPCRRRGGCGGYRHRRCPHVTPGARECQQQTNAAVTSSESRSGNCPWNWRAEGMSTPRKRRANASEVLTCPSTPVCCRSGATSTQSTLPQTVQGRPWRERPRWPRARSHRRSKLVVAHATAASEPPRSAGWRPVGRTETAARTRYWETTDVQGLAAHRSYEPCSSGHVVEIRKCESRRGNTPSGGLFPSVFP